MRLSHIQNVMRLIAG